MAIFAQRQNWMAEAVSSAAGCRHRRCKGNCRTGIWAPAELTMNEQGLSERLIRLERRLDRLEAHLRLPPAPADAENSPPAEQSPAPPTLTPTPRPPVPPP